MHGFWRGVLISLSLVLMTSPAAAIAASPDDGQTVRPTIINGVPATEAYPFVASLQSLGGGHFCGGALIRPNWIITAAHCVADETPSSFRIRVGSINRTSGGTVASVQRIVTHATNDQAVVQLTAPVSYPPIPIAASASPGTAIRLLGWGATADPGGSSPTILQQFDTQILADSAPGCVTGPAEICTDNPGNGGACYGDSGGPAVSRTANGWAIAGTTIGEAGSTDFCADNVQIYSDVPYHRSWVDSIVGGTSPTNIALNRPATGSASCNSNETPAKAVNGSVSGGNSDKWCSASGTVKLLRVDLGSVRSFTSVTVRHAQAGGESSGWNTRDFDIQVSNDGSTWTTVSQVRGNTSAVSTHPVTASGRFVRLAVIRATQNDNSVTRIYEFEVYA